MLLSAHLHTTLAYLHCTEGGEEVGVVAGGGGEAAPLTLARGYEGQHLRSLGSVQGPAELQCGEAPVHTRHADVLSHGVLLGGWFVVV